MLTSNQQLTNSMSTSLVVGASCAFTQGLDGEFRVAGNIGFGSRIYMNEWCSNLEVRDYIYQEKLSKKDSIYQDWVMTLGVSFFLPTSTPTGAKMMKNPVFLVAWLMVISCLPLTAAAEDRASGWQPARDASEAPPQDCSSCADVRVYHRGHL